jgi:hypothetical protein
VGLCLNASKAESRLVTALATEAGIAH